MEQKDPLTPKSLTFSQKFGLALGPLVGIMFMLFLDLDPGRPAATATAAVALWMAIWWITEALPLAATALLPMALFPLLGVMDGKIVAPYYFNDVIFLFLGGFLVALAMERWDLHKRIALRILLWFGIRPRGILFGFMAATAFISMWISNTATAMMMIPIAMAIVWKLEESLGTENVRRYAISIFLAIAYSASIGGIATLVGTPPNPALVKIFAIQFPQAPDITFSAWFVFAFPVCLIFLVIVWALLFLMFPPPPREVFSIDTRIFEKQYRELGSMSFEEWVVMIDFVALALLWLLREEFSLGTFTFPGWGKLFPHPEYLNDGVVAISLALLLFLAPARRAGAARILNWETAEKLPWGIVILFGGGFALAGAFKDSGLSAWVGAQLQGVSALPPLLIVLVICLLITFLTELTSNTATAQILLPILASLSVAIQVNPLLLMIPGAISCSCAFMLPVATPPNAIIFGAGRLQVSDMARAGFILNLVGAVLITAAMFAWGTVVFGIDSGQMPGWATIK